MADKTKGIIPKYRGERPLRLDTASGFVVKETYTPDDIRGVSYAQGLGNPGEYPFTRGIHKNMYRDRLWSKRFFTGLPTMQRSNERFKYLLERGETGLIIVPDTPGHMGIDPDHPRVKDHSGCTGTPMYSVECMEELFEGISLEDVAVDLRGDPTFASISEVAQYVACAEKRGLDPGKLRGSTINDSIHCHFTMHWDHFCNPLDLAIKLCVDLIEYSVKYMSLWHPLCVAGYDVRELGINAVQELAFTFAAAIVYIEACLKRGLKIDEFAPRIVFALGGQMDFFEEIAKLRTARRMWAGIMKERFGAKDPRSLKLIMSVKTSGGSLTTQQLVNNITRTTIESLAAVLGGVQSMEPCGYDEAVAEPSEAAATVGLNIQHIIAHETGVVNTADPLGGSFYVEHLTNEIEKETYKLLKEIEEMGGMVAATESGWCQQLVNNAFLERQREIEEKERIVVGVNEFVIPKEEEIPLPISPYLKEEQEIFREEIQSKARKLRETRDNKQVRAALEDLRKKAKKGEDENLFRPMVQAYKANATMGEILGVVREEYGYSYDPFGILNYPFQ